MKPSNTLVNILHVEWVRHLGLHMIALARDYSFRRGLLTDDDILISRGSSAWPYMLRGSAPQ
jgi:hypothetical protein